MATTNTAVSPRVSKVVIVAVLALVGLAGGCPFSPVAICSSRSVAGSTTSLAVPILRRLRVGRSRKVVATPVVGQPAVSRQGSRLSSRLGP